MDTATPLLLQQIALLQEEERLQALVDSELDARVGNTPDTRRRQPPVQAPHTLLYIHMHVCIYLYTYMYIHMYVCVCIHM